MPPSTLCMCTLQSVLAVGPAFLSNSDTDGMENPRVRDFAFEIASDNMSTWEASGPFRSYDELLKDVFFFISQNPGTDADDVAAEYGISLHEAIKVTEDLLKQGLLDFA